MCLPLFVEIHPIAVKIMVALEGFTKVIRLNPLGTINVCTKFLVFTTIH